MKRFFKKKSALTGLIVFTATVLTLILLPLFLELDPISVDLYSIKKPPSSDHVMGTDAVGRDVLSRLVYGGRMSIFIGVVSTLIGIIIGLVLGLLAGYYRGWVEQIVMRLADIFMSFPAMVLILTLVAVFGPSVVSVILVLGIMGWTFTAKLIYGNVLAVRNKEYVEAARSIGTGNLTIIIKEILPNSVAPLWMSLAFRMSQAILTESALSFLGAGIQAPQASWGNMITDAQNLSILTFCPWLWLPPSICLLITIFSINLVGEGIRDALDPKTV